MNLRSDNNAGLIPEARAGLLAAGITGKRTLAELDRWLAEHPA